MEKNLDDLFSKRGSTREAALSLLVNSFSNSCLSQFAGKNFATLLYRCLNSLKKGSSKEIVLASRLLALLAVTIGSGDNAHELYKESLPLISQALQSRNDSILLSMINTLAVVTFVGGNEFGETEASMQLIWQFTNLKSSENVALKKYSAPVISAAISAWSVLLTTVDNWNLNHNHWRGTIPNFLEMLEVDDISVSRATAEALTLVCKVGSLEKFGCDDAINDIISMKKGKDISYQLSFVEELKGIISNHAKKLLRLMASESSATKTLNGWSNISVDILKVLEGGCFHETSLKIGKHSLQIYSLCQLVQINFLKCLMGRGFVQHMVENDFLHDVFNFTPRKQNSGDELYISEREEAVIHLFVPGHTQRSLEDESMLDHRPTSSALRKAKTQLLNKQRMIKGKERCLFND